MFFRKNKRCSAKAKTQYSKEVREYLNQNSLIFIQKISDGVLSKEEITDEIAKEFLVEGYPISPMVEETDIVGQLLCILKEAGYVFSYSKNGKITLKNQELYNTIVTNHLTLSGAEIVDRLAYCCELTHGRLTYEQVEEVLGFHYPRPPYVGNVDKRICIIAFLKELRLPFKYDEEYVYFP